MQAYFSLFLIVHCCRTLKFWDKSGNQVVSVDDTFGSLLGSGIHNSDAISKYMANLVW